MILESLHKIKKAEADVQERIEHSKGDAIRIIEKAKAEADKLLSEKMKDAQTQAGKMREDAREKAINEGLTIANEWKTETEKLGKEAQQNLENAKEFILQSLLG